MSHFVYKKNLQNQNVRDKFIGDRKELQRARDAGTIDEQQYREAKRQITPAKPRRSRADSTGARSATTTDRASSVYSVGGDGSMGSGAAATSPPPPSPAQVPRVQMGSIFDRNNLSARIYKPQAQTEEQREFQKTQRKAAQLHELESATHHLGIADEDMFGSNAEFQRYRDSMSSSSSSARSSGNAARQRNQNRYGRLFSRKPPSLPSLPSPALSPPSPSSALRSSPSSLSLSSPPSRPPPSPPSADSSRRPPSQPLLSRTSSLNHHQQQQPSGPRSLPHSEPPPSRKASVAGTLISSKSTSLSFPLAPPPPPPPQPPTLADRLLFGFKETATAPVHLPQQPRRPAAPRSRRHSFSSDRPSTSASRHSRNSTGSRLQASSKMNKFPTPTDGGPVLGLMYGFGSSHFTPPSLMLMHVFFTLLAEFDVPTVFAFARDETFVTSPEPRVPHPGEPADYGAHLEKLRAVLRKRIWYLMAVKWLHFGHILNSPGHHLIVMGSGDCQGEERVASQPGGEHKILDLDGPAMGDWAWHAALEYSNASVYVTFASDSPVNSLLVSGQPIEYDSPGNVFYVQIPSGHTSLAPLQTGSMDVVSSRYLPSHMPKDGWKPLMLEVSRVLKHDGYLEMTVLDPVLDNMGPLLKDWVLENVLSDPDHPRTFDVTPSKSALAALNEAGFIVKYWWTSMPANSMHDELSTVTSSIGQFLYDELYAPRPKAGEAESDGFYKGIVRMHTKMAVWDDLEVMSECRTYYTSFRWLKIWAWKPPAAPLASE